MANSLLGKKGGWSGCRKASDTMILKIKRVSEFRLWVRSKNFVISLLCLSLPLALPILSNFSSSRATSLRQKEINETHLEQLRFGPFNDMRETRIQRCRLRTVSSSRQSLIEPQAGRDARSAYPETPNG